MTYNKYAQYKDESISELLLRLVWPFIWGPFALAIGIFIPNGWYNLAGVAALTVWLYMRTESLRSLLIDKRRYKGRNVDLKWLRKTIRNAAAAFDAAGLSMVNPRNPEGQPITPTVLNHYPCPQGTRLVVQLIPGVQHAGDFLNRLPNLETAFGHRLTVELSNNVRNVILIFHFTDPLSETRRPDDSPFGH